MRDVIDEKPAPVPRVHGGWWRTQQHGLRQVRLPVLAIWVAETIVVIAIVVMLAIR